MVIFLRALRWTEGRDEQKSRIINACMHARTHTRTHTVTIESSARWLGRRTGASERGCPRLI